MENNFFEFATEESSQDAFLAWCANWVNYDNELSQLGREFVRAVSGIEDVRSVKVYKQFLKIDVLLIVNKTTAVIIEDKVYSSEHDNQIQAYKETLAKCRNKNGITNIWGDEYAISEIKAVYLKTGNFYPNDIITKNKDEVDKTIDRDDLMKIISPYIEKSDIIKGFYGRLIHIGEWYKRYEDFYQNGDYDKAFSESYGQYHCFRTLFENKALLCDYEKSEDVIIACGSSSGKPYTWAWLWGKDGVCWLGYRLSKFTSGYAVSLRLYFECNDSDRPEIEKLYFRSKELFAEICAEHCYDKWILDKSKSINESENEIAKLYISKDTDSQLEYLYPLVQEFVNRINSEYDLNTMTTK